MNLKAVVVCRVLLQQGTGLRNDLWAFERQLSDIQASRSGLELRQDLACMGPFPRHMVVLMTKRASAVLGTRPQYSTGLGGLAELEYTPRGRPVLLGLTCAALPRK